MDDVTKTMEALLADKSLERMYRDLYKDIMAEKMPTTEEILAGMPTDEDFHKAIMEEGYTIGLGYKKK
jgi:hypothetical protein